MTATYKPAIKASDDPAFDPASGLFRPSAGGGGAFDPSSRYGGSSIGDFYDPATWYTDAGKTTVASSPGDLIYTMAGGRGTAVDMIQATAGSRPQIASDATHSAHAYYLSGAQKFITGTATYSSSANGLTIGARVKFAVGGSGATQIFMSEDWSAAADFLLHDSNADQMQAGPTAASKVVAALTDDGNWHTVIAVIGTGAAPTVDIYIDDMGTPAVSGSVSSQYSSNRWRTGKATDLTLMYHYRKFIIDNDETAALSDWATWLES